MCALHGICVMYDMCLLCMICDVCYVYVVYGMNDIRAVHVHNV